ncbi:MAG: hypothetical protein KGI78_02450 [Patescibacteria group bacterium]|nr:hypothetical protein [Patescibacteria group bacterium]MDE1944342.1 hypothetical protein [Patescibacteria group bacterium]MDE1945336.1 hypothetical protein [Patescibacteria group bacterium]MDE2057692.1 hypothetical protein [Patescibacteria group bacterium]
MRSRFESLRAEAVARRTDGCSIREIEAQLGIPRSTLSGWLRGIPLATSHQASLKRRADESLARARAKAAAWHRNAKKERLARIKEQADGFIDTLDMNETAALELALAFLYLGEGSKKNTTSLGSSDPRILRFFVSALHHLYAIPRSSPRCELHLRADQDEKHLTTYWSRTLGVPRKNFGKSSFDKRTTGRPTYSQYKGVCLVRCGRLEIQRRLLYIADSFCEKAASRAVSSVGRASA